MTLASPSREKHSTGSGVVLALLAIVVFLNFFDRSNLSIAAPLLKDELHLSASQLGLLLSSFFWGYTLCQIPAGWIVDRYGANWVLAGGFFVWSCATFVTGLLHGFAALLVIRLILGIGESVRTHLAGAYWRGTSQSNVVVSAVPLFRRGKPPGLHLPPSPEAC